MDLQSWLDWASNNWERFTDDLLYTALNAFVFAFLFGTVTGWVLNWFRRRSFVAMRDSIAIDAAALNTNLMRICAAAFDAINARDVEAYKRAKSEANKFQNSLNTFLSEYAPYFTATQSARYRNYKREAEALARRLDWGNVTKEMHENDIFKLESMSWLFSADRFGPLSEAKFIATENLMNDFLKSLGLWWWKRNEYMADTKVKDAANSLLTLKATIERASGKTLDARPRILISSEAA